MLHTKRSLDIFSARVTGAWVGFQGHAPRSMEAGLISKQLYKTTATLHPQPLTAFCVLVGTLFFENS
jgi:hypothetical protein